jgi:hypothetical protein
MLNRRQFIKRYVLAAAVISTTGPAWAQAPGGPAARAPLPLVILMDSAHPARVYDEETVKANRTNADVISDMLADLPIRRHTETISPDWNRDDAIRQLQPALIVIHYSGFNLEDASGPRERLKKLISALAVTPVQFLIYSRAKEADLQGNLSKLLSDVYAAHPGLQARIRAFGLYDYGPPQWVNTPTGPALKRVVRELLKLP